jgi:putative PIG3 family NAD(P)H quinone oxidoreductase
MPKSRLPSTMSAITIREPGGPDVLAAAAQPVPSPGEGEILVKVAAAGVNRPDVLQRQGNYPPPKGATEIPGLEIAGEIAAIGSGVTRWKEGDTVMALVVGGGYAEYCLAFEGHALPVPANLTMIEAAAIPETFFTIWHNVFERGRLKAGETLLVHGGSSGIGTAAIALAKAFGARVITTAGTSEKCEACRKLGADLAIDYKAEDFVALTKEATQGRGADLILDMVGGEYVGRNYEAAAVEGRIVQIAFIASPRVNVDLMPLMLKRLTHTGSTLRARAVADKAAIARAVETNVLPLIAAGRVKPVIDSTFPLDQASAAQAHMESGKHIGKIVLTL